MNRTIEISLQNLTKEDLGAFRMEVGYIIETCEHREAPLMKLSRVLR